MIRERWLVLYCLVVGALGWVWLLASAPGHAPPGILVLFLMLALLVESAGFRVPPSDPHSLVGIVLLSAAITLGPADGALVAALSGLIFGAAAPLIYGRARTIYLLVARPVLRSGVRAIALLLGALLAQTIGGNGLGQPLGLIIAALCYALIIQLNRVVREYLQGGRSGVLTWWRASWRAALSAEIAPLPIAWLGAAIFTRLGIIYFLLASATLLAASLTVRRAAIKVQQQRRSVRELALLNQASRAIIRAEMDVDALCDLIYREATKVVDTSSFHLGLFAPGGDEYTLVVRVQDRVRLPPLTIELPSGDGLIGWMRQTGRALLVEDFAAEMDSLPARPRYQSDRPPRAGIYVPLIDGETVIGTISIQSYRRYAFDADDMRLLSLIADQAAVAIAKAYTFYQARERAVQLQAIHEVGERITAILDMDELLASVVQLIRERFIHHPIHIFTLEPDGQLLFRASTSDLTAQQRMRASGPRVGEGIVGAVAQHGRPLLINDVAADRRYISDNPHTRSELAVPLRFGDNLIGVLDVQSAEPKRFSNADLFVMQTLAGQIAVAIESARAFEAQREEAWTLNALLQVSENLAHASTLAELLPAIVRLPPLLLGCDRCYCLVSDRARTSFTPLASYGLPAEARAAFVGVPIADAQAPALAEARHTLAPVVIRSPQARPRAFPPTRVALTANTLVVVPLTARGATLGLLVADYDDVPQPLGGRVLTLYAGLSSQIAGALESSLLAQDAAAASRLEEEVRVARGIQTSLLPAHPPAIPGWDLAADWRSARLVGGDFYDFWRLNKESGVRSQESEVRSQKHNIPSANPRPLTPDPRSLGFVIADVSDKGVAAALFMTLSRSLVRAAALDGSPPSVALARANRWITRDSDSAMFVTLFYGVLDVDSGLLRYCCAGHNPPLLIRAADGAVEELKTPGIALGVIEEARLGEAEVPMQPGDVLVCYTDGITEAIDGTDADFGVPRLIAAAVAHRSESAAAIVTAINDALRTFTGAREPFDDVTMVVVKREKANVKRFLPQVAEPTQSPHP